MSLVIVGLGEVLWDMLPDGKQLGGAPANFAYHVKALGLSDVNTHVISAVGNDQLGKEIADLLKQKDINITYLSMNCEKPTGTVSVSLNRQGNPCYKIEQNTAWDFIPDYSKNFAKNVKAVCFGTLAQRSPVSKNNINKFLSSLPDETLKIFDINLRQTFFNLDIIESSLNQANIFKINDDELKIVSKLLHIAGNEKQQLEILALRYNIKLGILTKGVSGSILYSADKWSIHPGYSIKVIDTIGAGDAFTAAIALGLLNDYTLDTMNTCANKVAAYVCSCSGATPHLPVELVSLFNKPRKIS